jgi:hypothetical protein
MLIKMKKELEKKKSIIKPEKKEKIDISKIIKKACEGSQYLFIFYMGKEHCILLKKNTETVLRTLCPGTMNPVETQKEITTFNCFALYWPLTKTSKLDSSLISLMKYGFPVHTIETEYDIKKAIQDS